MPLHYNNHPYQGGGSFQNRNQFQKYSNYTGQGSSYSGGGHMKKQGYYRQGGNSGYSGHTGHPSGYGSSHYVPDIEIIQVNPNLFHAFFKVSNQSKATLLNPQSLVEIQKDSQTKLRLKRTSETDLEPSIIQIEGKKRENVENALVFLAYYAKYGFTMYSFRIFIDLGENIEPRFDLPSRIRGQNDAYLHHIETKCKNVQVKLKGKNSGKPVGIGKKREDEDSELSLHIHLVSSSRKSLQNAQMLAESLISKVKKDYTDFVHSKMNSSIGDYDWISRVSQNNEYNKSIQNIQQDSIQNLVSSINSDTTNIISMEDQEGFENSDNYNAMEDENDSTVISSNNTKVFEISETEGGEDFATSQLPNQVVKQVRKVESIDINSIKQTEALLNLKIDFDAKKKLGLLVQEMLF